MQKRWYVLTLTAVMFLFAASCGGSRISDVGDVGGNTPVVVGGDTGEVFIKAPDLPLDKGSASDGNLPADEIVYMSDFKYYTENHLYSVYLNEGTGEAELTDLGAFPSNGTDPPGRLTFNAQIGTTADGTRVYCIDYWTGMIVYYDADEDSADYGTFVDPGIYVKTSGNVLHVGEVTFGSPYEGNDWGDLFVSTTNNHVYRVNPLTGAAEDMGTIAYDLGGTINISAGDLAFDDEENFYLLTVGSPPGKGIYLIEGWEGDGPWTLTGSQVRPIGDTAQYRGLAILDGGAGDWLGDNDTGGSPPDYIVRFGANDSEDTSYPMYLDGSLFNHGAGGDMSVGRLGQEQECPPYETDLIAGQHYDAGDVIIEPVDGQLKVTYKAAEGWCIYETHLHVATSPDLIPQANGNPVPGRFDYKDKHDCETEVVYYIDPAAGWCDEPYLYIAAHAVVKNADGGGDTAWGDGIDFPGKNWATYIVWEVCCP